MRGQIDDAGSWDAVIDAEPSLTVALTDAETGEARMFPQLDRVSANALARTELGWQPRHDFRALIARLRAGEDIRSPLAREVGSKGYHDRVFHEGPYPVE